MKKIIAILLLLIISSCGSRKVETAKSTEKQSEKTETKTETTTETNGKRAEKVFETADFSSLNLSILPKFDKSVNDNSKEDKICPKEIIYIKDKNGNTAQIPVKLDSKINFGSNTTKTEKTTEIEQELAEKTKENVNLKADRDYYKKESEKKTERKGLGFGDLIWIIPLSMIFGVLIYLLVKSYYKIY